MPVHPNAHPPDRTPWFLLGVAFLGVALLWVIAGSWATLRPPPQPVVPAPNLQPVIEVQVTMPPWPTPERTPTPSPWPTIPPIPTNTPIPYYDPRFATPGRLYQIPPPTPPPPTPYPTCSLSLPSGTRCIAPAPTPTPVPTLTAEPSIGPR
jgi:hypothetical protein